MTKRLIWCCSCCRRKPPGQTIWLETWCPWSWCTDHQGQSWKTKRRERAEQPPCPLPAPRVQPWWRYLDIPKSDTLTTWDSPTRQFRAACKKRRCKGRRSALKGCHRHLAAFSPVQQTVLKNRRIKVTSYHTKKVRTWSPNAFCTFYSLHAPCCQEHSQPSVWPACLCCPEGAETDSDYPQPPTVPAP